MTIKKRIARGKELLRLINQGEEQMVRTSEQIKEWNEELDGLFSGAKPGTTRRKSGTSAKRKAKAAATGGNWSGRGAITAALRVALKSMPGEFTARELIAEAKIPDAQAPSAAAAISRMKPKEIKDGSTRGKYRRA